MIGDCGCGMGDECQYDDLPRTVLDPLDSDELRPLLLPVSQADRELVTAVTSTAAWRACTTRLPTETMMRTDAELAEAILRKISHDYGGCILVERHPKGNNGALIDSGWFDVTAEEADYLDRLHRESDR